MIINRVSNLWCEKLCFLYYNYYVVLNGCVREINCRRLQFCNYYNKESFYQFNLKPCLVLSEDFQIQPTFQVGNFLNNIRYDNEEIQNSHYIFDISNLSCINTFSQILRLFDIKSQVHQNCILFYPIFKPCLDI